MLADIEGGGVSYYTRRMVLCIIPGGGCQLVHKEQSISWNKRRRVLAGIQGAQILCQSIILGNLIWTGTRGFAIM